MSATTVNTRPLFTRERIDVETLIAITFDKPIRLTLFIGTKCITLGVERAELLAQLRSNGITHVKVDEYSSTVYICADI